MINLFRNYPSLLGWKLDKDLNKCETQTWVVSNLHKDTLPKIDLLSTTWQQKSKKNGENSEVKDNN